MTAIHRIRTVFSVGLLAAAGACAGPASVESPSLTASPSEVGSPSEAASPTPTAGSTAAPAIQKGMLAEVLIAGLDVRTEPSSSAPIVTRGNAPAQLNVGEAILVLSDPDRVDETWWVRVGIGEGRGSYRGSVVVGWVEGGTRDDPWMAENDSACREPTFAGLLEMSALERLTCLGSDSITFRAHQASVIRGIGLGGACNTGQPAGWLLCDNINYNLINSDGGTEWQFLLHFDPATGIPETELADPGETGALLRITGHFDDPASHLCVTAADAASNQAVAERLTCAIKFVVEDIQPIG